VTAFLIHLKKHQRYRNMHLTWRFVMQRLAEQLWRDSPKSNTTYVLDISSNDGTWFQYFKNLGAKAAGIEPSLLSRIGTVENITSVVLIFDEQAKQFYE
jgi:hypothetical protein